MSGQLDSLVVIFTEFYYWVTVVMMFLIHVGFCVVPPDPDPPGAAGEPCPA